MIVRIDLGTHVLGIDRGGEGPPSFLCLHGLADTREIWSRITPSLARLGEVVSVDQRGHGESGAPAGPFRREDLAADVALLLDRVRIDRAILVGHSMGGIVAMTTALAFPERVSGLVLVGTASQCNRKAADWYETIARAGEQDGTEGLRRAIFGPGSRREIGGDAGAIARVTRCLSSLYDDPLTPRLHGIHCPTLVLVGSKDPMGATASSILLDGIPAASLEVVPDRGHWLHVETPEGVARSIERFVLAEASSLGIRRVPHV